MKALALALAIAVAIAIAIAVAVAVAVAGAFVFDFRLPFRSDGAGGKNPKGGAHGRASFFDETWMSRRKIPPAEWTQHAARAGRVGRGVLSLGYVSLHEQRRALQQPNGWSRWLAAAKQGAKAFAFNLPLYAWPLAWTFVLTRWYKRPGERPEHEGGKHESKGFRSLLRGASYFSLLVQREVNQEKARPAYAPDALRASGPLRRRDFSTRHPCRVEKRRASLHAALRVIPVGSVAAEGDA
ncbi:MAG: hypothetical protein ACWGG5_04415 [Stenotrophomonas sp.]